MKRASKSAAKLAVLENNDPISAEIEAIQSLIRQRAFELSHRRPDHAREIYDWIAAESEIISVPPAEVIEKDGIFDVKFALAGVHPENVNVMATSNQILVKCVSSHTHEMDAGTVHLCDFESATFFRSVALPEPIDLKSIKLDFEDGVLHVSAAKEGVATVAPVRPKRAAPARKAAAKKK
jgi:HSP20 family molecular chaperone IbpA